MNFLLAKDFTKTHEVLYPNLLKEFWCTAIPYDPNPPVDNSEDHPPKEYKINILVMNSKKPLTLDFKTFTKSIGLDYNKGTYVSYPSPKAEKAELAKIVTNKVLTGSYSSIKQINSIQQMIAYCLITETKVDIGTGNTKPLPKGPREDKDLERLKLLADIESQTPLVTDLSGTNAKYPVDQTQSTRLRDTNASNSESSSSSESSRPYDNFIPVTERAGRILRSKLLYGKNLPLTLRERMKIITTTKKPKDIETKKSKEEPARASKAIPISTVIPLTRPNPEIRLIEFSSRPPLTDTTLEFLVSKPKT
nr:hypothetical protein [Tanacetum cinerariifolium]